MNYKNKRYSTIIWDWRSTIYDPVDESIFPWLPIFLKEYKVNNILVSWAGNPQKRTELINSYPIMKKFQKIYVTGISKREVFEYIFDSEGYDPDKTIIVGDNANDELALAKDMGVDCEHVDKFIANLHLLNKDNR